MSIPEQWDEETEIEEEDDFDDNPIGPDPIFDDPVEEEDEEGEDGLVPDDAGDFENPGGGYGPSIPTPIHHLPYAS